MALTLTAMLVALAPALASPVLAQDASATSGSGATGSTDTVGASESTGASTTSSTSTTAAPSPTTSSTTPPSTTTAPPPPPPEPIGGEPEEDAATEPPPQDEVVIPPPAVPPPPDPAAPVLQETALEVVDLLARQMEQAALAAEAAAQEVLTLETEVGALQARLAQLEAERQTAVDRLQEVRARMRRRAVASYVGSPAAQVNHVLEAEDINELDRRLQLLGAIVEADRNRREQYAAAKEAAGAELARVVAKLDGARSALTIASAMANGATSALLTSQVRFAAAQAGGDIVAAGFVFPVAGPHSYSDTFGAPRMFGTQYAHYHEGTDIFAASGTPLVACERGVLVKVGTDVLGGTKLWLVGASGTRYYYAHLSAYAEGVAEGKLVEAGEVIGYVGNTGNARTTPAHLHFEVHPGGGPAINPYPMLRIVDGAHAKLASSG